MNFLRFFILGMVWSLTFKAFAMEWNDLWHTPDQQAKALFEGKYYAQAQQKFQRLDWRALAAYRAKDYSLAAKDYLTLNTAAGYYNAGNALAFSQKYPQAIEAYNQALRLNPKDQDAIFNRQLVQKLLKKQQNQNKDQPDESKQKDDPKPSQAASKNPPQQPSHPQQPKPQNQAKAMPKDTKPKVDKKLTTPKSTNEQQEANAQWLKLIPDDPGGLLRQKFLRDHIKRQNGTVS